VRRRAIARAADAVLRAGKVVAPPVPIERLIHKQGARLVLRSLNGNVSGFVHSDAEGNTIGVNSAHSRNRQRFTMAHELGHLVLHDLAGVRVDERDFSVRFKSTPTRRGDDEEQEANLFAAELLMPVSQLAQDAEKLGEFALHDDKAVRKTAARYGVSVQTLIVRLTSLGLIEGSPLA